MRQRDVDVTGKERLRASTEAHDASFQKSF